MKRTVVFITIAILGIQFFFAQDASAQGRNVDSLQYAFGAYMGKFYADNRIRIYDTASFNRGFNDFVSGRKLLIKDSLLLQFMLANYRFMAQVDKNRQDELQLFQALPAQKDLVKLPNGVYYRVMKQGTGKNVRMTDSVFLNIVGVTAGGSLVENTYQRKKLVGNTPSEMIEGLKTVLPLMQKGSKWQVYIPSSLAYGDRGVPGLIDPAAAVVFEVEVDRVKPITAATR